MPLKQIEVMHGNAIKLALQYFNDATAFIDIMEENELDDWIINGPIILKSQTNNIIGDTLLVVEPSNDIALGMSVYCAAYESYGIVVNIEQVFTTPKMPLFFGYEHLAKFAQYASIGAPATIPDRVLPPSGRWVSSNITVAPPLDNFLLMDSPVTFTVATPKTITIPSRTTDRGSLI